MQQLRTVEISVARKRRELEELRRQLQTAEAEMYRSLPSLLGLASVDELIKALTPYASGHGSREAGANRRKRSFIDDATRRHIIAHLRKGNMLAREIAEKFGISVAAVNRIKLVEGLTKKRQG